ncbi:MAG: Putative ABC transporter substrate binding protein [candidate division WS6 bacterium 34_10]|uniref:Putative ABC transporter substrate binding protein n=1 Tax=candidate division WS6 bacterium 34_10 TaxID=1641389 RepID=A0A101HHZ7_9BACT|nr:MAG: Putative ABC transporter substrate binding protein [candidate division WS6 bacterium 34_10]
MKEAFDNVTDRVTKKRTVRNGKRKKNSVRDFFWNYPVLLVRIWNLTSPLSTILLFLILGLGLFSFLRSDTFAEKVSSRELNYYVEGRVGAISTFNPLFTNQNDIDKTIQELVFEKFVYIDSTGQILPGVATDWDISDSGKKYVFDIALDRTWSDGTPLTMDDILFTFNTAIALHEEQGYDTVASSLADVDIEIVDNDTIQFTLPETNSVFPELTSVYIVPKHILEGVSLYEMPFDRFSRNPVGSGPYRIYRSEPNIVYLEASEYYQPTPNISNIIMRVYSDMGKLESAFRNGLLDAVVVPNDERSDFVKEYSSYNSYRLDLPYRQRNLFFNLRKEKIQNDSLRKGLSMLIDKERLLEESGINGEIATGPIYEESWAFSDEVEYATYNPERAAEILKDGGYTKNEDNGYFETEDGKLLTVTISYLDNEINTHLLNTLASLLEEEGVILNLEALTYSQLTQEILATRNFEVLMYEIELTVDPDQYNLWHSLQKDYPNLNLSGYEFSRVDIILEEARREFDKGKRKERYALFQKYLMADVPAIFLYRPSYLYVVREGVSGLQYEDIVRLEDIYRNICTWEFEK